MLYHHCDGYPDAMLWKLATLLGKALSTLQERGFHVDSEKLAAMVVAGSVSDAVPAFYPCCKRHEDIDYLYEVCMDRDGGTISAMDRGGHDVGKVVIHREDGEWQMERHA